MSKIRPQATCHPDRPHMARGLCSACYQTRWRQENPEKYKARPRRRATCHPDRPVLARDLCQSCYRRQWRAENPEQSKALGRKLYHRRAEQPGFRELHARRVRARRYGLTIDELDELIQAHGEHCGACGTTQNLHVDHCHDSGAIRGLLCGGCNSAAGQTGDDPVRLRAIADYLERFKQSTLAQPES